MTITGVIAAYLLYLVYELWQHGNEIWSGDYVYAVMPVIYLVSLRIVVGGLAGHRSRLIIAMVDFMHQQLEPYLRRLEREDQARFRTDPQP